MPQEERNPSKMILLKEGKKSRTSYLSPREIRFHRGSSEFAARIKGKRNLKTLFAAKTARALGFGVRPKTQPLGAAAFEKAGEAYNLRKVEFYDIACRKAKESTCGVFQQERQK